MAVRGLSLLAGVALTVLSLNVQPSYQQLNCTATPTLDITYQLEFPEADCSNETGIIRPTPVSVTLVCNMKAQRVMELGVDADASLQFTTTYLGASNGGYRVDTVNGTTATDVCLWFLFYQAPGMTPVWTRSSVSDYVVPDNGGIVILRYQKEPVPVASPTPTPTPDGAVTTRGGVGCLLLAAVLASLQLFM